MQLKTICKSCIFEGNEGPCSLGKFTFSEGIGQITMGFCQQKRTEKWAKKYEHLSAEEWKGVIEKEERLLTVIIKSKDNNLKMVHKTLASLEAAVIDDTSVLLIFNNLPITEIKDLSAKLGQYKGLKWQIENYCVEGEHFASPMILDISLRLIGTSWFMYLEAGNRVKSGTFGMLRHNVASPDNSYVCYYFDNHSGLVTTKEAFLKLDGNLEEAWFDKIKQFDNWKEICKCIH